MLDPWCPVIERFPIIRFDAPSSLPSPVLARSPGRMGVVGYQLLQDIVYISYPWLDRAERINASMCTCILLEAAT